MSLGFWVQGLAGLGYIPFKVLLRAGFLAGIYIIYILRYQHHYHHHDQNLHYRCRHQIMHPNAVFRLPWQSPPYCSHGHITVLRSQDKILAGF